MSFCSTARPASRSSTSRSSACRPRMSPASRRRRLSRFPSSRRRSPPSSWMKRTSPISAKPTASRFSSQLQKDPGRPGVQSAELERDRRHSRLSRRSELVRGVVRPDERVALRQLEQCPEHHHARRIEGRRQTEIWALWNDWIREVSRPRGLSGNQAAVGGLDRDQPEHGRIRLAGSAGRAC